MENPFNIKDVIDACVIITRKDPNKTDLKKAEKYLIAFQKSPQAWALTYEILSMENLELAIYAQVSILLKQKLQYDFYQVPESDYLNITKALLGKLCIVY